MNPLFTNLTQDHLDLHGSMAEYFEAKAQLFTAQRTRRAVVVLSVLIPPVLYPRGV